MDFDFSNSDGTTCLLLSVLLVVASVIQGVLVYAVWNWLLVDSIGVGLPHIAFWQAILVGFVISILFNSK